MIKIVRAKIKNTALQQVKAKVNPHMPDASLIMPFSLSHPIIPERDAHISRLSLFKYREAITGKVSNKTAIKAITPHEFFITPTLEVTVLKASDIEGPTMGIKLPIANFAVFIERESTLWVRVL